MWATSIIQINRVQQHTAKTIEEKKIYQPGRFPGGRPDAIIGRAEIMQDGFGPELPVAFGPA
jgi:hypothetical protein